MKTIEPKQANNVKQSIRYTMEERKDKMIYESRRSYSEIYTAGHI